MPKKKKIPGRPKEEKSIQVAVRMKESFWLRVKASADARQQDIGPFIKLVLSEKLHEYEAALPPPE